MKKREILRAVGEESQVWRPRARYHAGSRHPVDFDIVRNAREKGFLPATGGRVRGEQVFLPVKVDEKIERASVFDAQATGFFQQCRDGIE